jgi:hypothetical protein
VFYFDISGAVKVDKQRMRIVAGVAIQDKQFSAKIKTIGRTCFWISIIVVVIDGNFN